MRRMGGSWSAMHCLSRDRNGRALVAGGRPPALLRQRALSCGLARPDPPISRTAGAADAGRNCPYCRFTFKPGSRLCVPGCSARASRGLLGRQRRLRRRRVRAAPGAGAARGAGGTRRHHGARPTPHLLRRRRAQPRPAPRRHPAALRRGGRQCAGDRASSRSSVAVVAVAASRRATSAAGGSTTPERARPGPPGSGHRRQRRRGGEADASPVAEDRSEISPCCAATRRPTAITTPTACGSCSPRTSPATAWRRGVAATPAAGRRLASTASSSRSDRRLHPARPGAERDHVDGTARSADLEFSIEAVATAASRSSWRGSRRVAGLAGRLALLTADGQRGQGPSAVACGGTSACRPGSSRACVCA